MLIENCPEFLLESPGQWWRKGKGQPFTLQKRWEMSLETILCAWLPFVNLLGNNIPQYLLDLDRFSGK
ncbi:hypothetical protein [Rufibacter hautae]|uniref:Uncharacterized protein n=1 Tax=Rufibacter hautae TaxID=2595005 RepID=A0A5B6TG27_9BACT|nr:hypothetical protein [Rufibacter hautae]KAA3439371.1 hypothetical protein FOA19_01410 [Rufibacter hautae]